MLSCHCCKKCTLQNNPQLCQDKLLKRLTEHSYEAETDFAADVSEDAKNIYVEMHVPGINPDHININVRGDELIISGSREETQETEDRHYYFKEIIRGDFERHLTLNGPVNEKETKAEFHNGTLWITLSKKVVSPEHKVSITKK